MLKGKNSLSEVADDKTGTFIVRRTQDRTQFHKSK